MKQQGRGASTHVALICDIPAVQAVFPQIVLVNRRLFPETALADAHLHESHNVEIWRRQSAWCDHSVMCKVLHRIRDIMDVFPTLQPIVTLDCAPARTATTP